jgi:hypothetical protein
MKRISFMESKLNGSQVDIKNQMVLLFMASQTEPGKLGTTVGKDGHPSLMIKGLAMVRSSYGILTVEKKRKVFIPVGKRKEHGKDGL